MEMRFDYWPQSRSAGRGKRSPLFAASVSLTDFNTHRKHQHFGGRGHLEVKSRTAQIPGDPGLFYRGSGTSATEPGEQKECVNS